MTLFLADFVQVKWFLFLFFCCFSMNENVCGRCMLIFRMAILRRKLFVHVHHLFAQFNTASNILQMICARINSTRKKWQSPTNGKRKIKINLFRAQWSELSHCVPFYHASSFIFPRHRQKIKSFSIFIVSPIYLSLKSILILQHLIQLGFFSSCIFIQTIHSAVISVNQSELSFSPHFHCT